MTHLAASGWRAIAFAAFGGGASVVLVWLVHRGVTSRWRDAPGDERLLASATIVASLVTASAMLLGAFALLTPASWIAVTLLGACAFAVALDRGPGGPGRTQPPRATSAWFQSALAALTFTQVLHAARNPPADRDSISYHLPMAAHWLATHALGAPLRFPPESATYYPGNVETLFAWTMAILHSDAAVGLVPAAALLLLALAVRRLAIRRGAAEPVAEGLALLLVTAPVCITLAKGLYCDAAMAAAVVIALIHLERWREQGAAKDCTVALLALGWAAGCRYTGVAYVVLAVGIAWLAPGRTRRLTPAPLAAWLAPVVLGGFWLVRNAIAAGNPFYPAEAAFLGHTLPGTIPLEMLRRTTQLAAWREGQAGHLTLANLWTYYRGVAVAVALGGAALLLPRARHAVRGAWLPAGFALLAFALFLGSYYSGVVRPSLHGEPPLLAGSNVRYLLPAWAAGLAALAPGISVLAPATGLGAVLALASGAQALALGGKSLAILLGVFAALLLASRVPRLGRWSVAAVVGVCLLLPLPFARSRGALERIAWQTYEPRLTLLPAALADSLRAEAHGRVVAMTGLEGSYEVTGSGLAGRPAYVPVARTWRASRSMWDFTADERARATEALWRANLRTSGAAFVAIGWPDTTSAPVESLWCARDTARFALRAARPRRLVYAVR